MNIHEIIKSGNDRPIIAIDRDSQGISLDLFSNVLMLAVSENVVITKFIVDKTLLSYLIITAVKWPLAINLNGHFLDENTIKQASIFNKTIVFENGLADASSLQPETLNYVDYLKYGLNFHFPYRARAYPNSYNNSIILGANEKNEGIIGVY